MLSISYCPYCGSGLREGYKFCQNCGTDLTKKTKEEKFTGSFWIAVSVSVLVIVGLAIVGHISTGEPGLAIISIWFMPFIAGIIAGTPRKGALAAGLSYLVLWGIIASIGPEEEAGFIGGIVWGIIIVGLLFLTPLIMLFGAIGGSIGRRRFQNY